MRHAFTHPLRPSTGEKRLLAAAGAVGLCGGLISFTIVTQMGQNKVMLRVLTQADLWFVAAGMFGALSGLYLGRRWMGHGGLLGVLRAMAGVLVVSFMGALIGGTLALPFYGTMFGPLMFGLTLAGNPLLAIVWLNTLVMTHLLVRVWRRERDSIFAPIIVPVLPRATPSSKTSRNWLTPSLDRAKL